MIRIAKEVLQRPKFAIQIVIDFHRNIFRFTAVAIDVAGARLVFGQIFQIKFGNDVESGAFGEREKCGQKEQDAAAENGVLGARESLQQIVAHSQQIIFARGEYPMLFPNRHVLLDVGEHRFALLQCDRIEYVAEQHHRNGRCGNVLTTGGNRQCDERFDFFRFGDCVLQ